MSLTNPRSFLRPSRKFGRSRGSTLVRLGLISASLCLCGEAQVPPTDSRNTTIPHTDYHFTPRTYRTLAEWQEQRAHLRKQILSASGLLPMPPKTPLHPQIFGKTANRTYTTEKLL